ncbi:hypothetical protein RJ640_004673 [Escallonia rubra]|uniref:KIB1-4 beta-propeller domain-containing protein n=1 Tax=Escallonia rubra TaxID=112253 RepID=A0AA88RER9_9ASTE|nr:hypothetical protein RJ640_004673 [Escallonia rubra]
MEEATTLREYPCLLYRHGEDYKGQTCYTLSTSPSSPHGCTVSSYECTIPELHGKKTMASCHGWWVLSDDSDDTLYSLWNPATSESIILPPIPESKHDNPLQIECCTLSSAPGNPDSMLLLLQAKIQSILVCGLGDKQWSTEMHYRDDIEDLLWRPISCNGKLYAKRCGEPNLARIDIARHTTNDDQYSLVVKPTNCWLLRPPLSHSFAVATQMVESCGDLFTTCIALGGISFEEAIAIEIYKLNFITMVWEKVDSVKDRAFFLDSGGSTSRSCSAAASNESSSNITGDCVYFMDYKKSLYIYHIEDGTVSVLLPCPDLPTPCLLPIWMMPPPTLRSLQANDVKIDLEEEEEKNAVKVDQQKENTEEEDMQAKLGTKFCDLPLDMLKLIGSLLEDYYQFKDLEALTKHKDEKHKIKREDGKKSNHVSKSQTKHKQPAYKAGPSVVKVGKGRVSVLADKRSNFQGPFAVNVAKLQKGCKIVADRRSH